MRSVRGTKDLYDQDLNCFRYICNQAQALATLYGFKEIQTPIMEYTEVFLKPLGEDSDIVGKEMYTFPDRGGESLTLRPEGTAPMIRSMLTSGLIHQLPQKRFTYGPFFRYERPQKGRQRQFHQISVEYVGEKSYLADVEILAFAYRLLKKINVQDFALHLNTLGDFESRKQYREHLVTYLTQYKDELSEDSQRRLEKNPLRILDSKNEGDQKICENAPRLKDFLTTDSKVFFEQICESLNKLDIPFIENTSLVRGLDYYCHTVFEFKSTALGAQDTLLGGGRYDGLIKMMGGADVPSVGFGCGLERLMLACQVPEEKGYDLKVVLCPESEAQKMTCLELAQKIRNCNIACEIIHPGPIQKRIQLAENMQAHFFCFVGSQEQENQEFMFKVLKPTAHLYNLPSFEKKISIESFLNNDQLKKVR